MADKVKFTGGIDELRERLSECGTINDERLINHGHQFHFNGRGCISWYPRQGTLLFQGPVDEVETLRKMYFMLEQGYEKSVGEVMRGLPEGASVFDEFNRIKRLPVKFVERWVAEEQLTG